MMIDKRLVNAVPNAKKYVFLTVLLRWLALLANTALIFSVSVILKTRGENVLLPALLILLCLCVSVVSNIASSYTSYRSSSQVKKTLRSKIYQKLLRLGAEYQESSTTAKIVQLATEGVEQLETWFSSFLPQFFYSMLAAVTSFAVLAFLNLRMALTLLVCIPLIPISMMIVQGIAKKLLGKYWAQYASLADNFLENLQGLTTLQIYRADEFKAAQMAKEAEYFRKVTMKVLSMQLNSIIIMDIVAYGGAALGIVVALSAFYIGNLSMENAFVCILLSADFFIPLRRLGSAFHTAMNGITASKNIFEFLDTKEKTHGTKALPPLKENQINVYELVNAGYEFERTVLKNCSLVIEKNTCTAFVGKSGSGKSTVAKIFSCIYTDYTGIVLINGEELKDVSLDSVYKHTTYISHHDWIFAGSVRDCLLEGKNSARDEEIWQVLQEVNLDSFVKAQGGLDFKIAEGGENLSGGQRQRLSIARALLKNSEVYIFDEATSNIDVESESAILELLEKLKNQKTIILITHRIENCENADRIYRFENGEVSAVSKEELL